MNSLLRNIRMEIEYDGTNYCGWQIQSRNFSKKSIQQVLEQTLKKILHEKVKLIASGRTDAGVHAQGQVANFYSKSIIPLEKLQRSLNALLPDDIVVKKVALAPLDFHARFQAKSKLYRYTIINRNVPSVFMRQQALFYPYPLNLKLMRQEAKALLGRHNLKAFQAAGKKEKSTTKEIKYISIQKNNDIITIDIEADGFLHHMARNIVGTLIEIGRGRFPKGTIKQLLKLKDRKKAGPTAAACGLCLMKVNYS